MKRIWNLGVKDSQPVWLQEKLRLTNKIALVQVSILTFFLLLLITKTPGLMPPILIAAASFGSVLWLNSIGWWHVSRILLSITNPILVCYFIGVMTPVDGQPSYTVFVSLISCQVIPYVIFNYTERGLLLTTIFINVVNVLGYKVYSILFFNETFFKTMQQTNDGSSDMPSIISALLVINFFLWLLSQSFKKMDDDNAKLLAEVEVKNKNSEQAQADSSRMLEEVQKARVEEDRRNWISNGIAELLVTLRSEQDANKLYDKVLKQLVKFTGANQGALILYNEAEKMLEMKAAYAYDRKKFLEKKIMPGEGLAGTCFIEKERIYLTEVPANYVNITSGLGEATPSCVILLPLINNDQVEGILEMAFFKVLAPHEIEFLEKASENVASVLYNIKINDNVRNLLESSQMNMEELKAQEEEMRQNMEELMATQEELKRKEESYLSRIAELEEALASAKR